MKKHWLKINWERILFRIIGIILFGFGFQFLLGGNLSGMATTFGFSIFCFMYANISQFKRFKGLGFEAELWEDKQKEASNLVEKLKNVVSIYSRELILNKVKSGHWSDGPGWDSTWDLYDEIRQQHIVLGQEIDFSDVKKTLDQYMILDIINEPYNDIRLTLSKCRSNAMDKINQEFGSPIKDSVGYGRRLGELGEIQLTIDDLFEQAQRNELAIKIIQLVENAKKAFSEHFDIDVAIDEKVMSQLEACAKLEKQDSLKITPQLVNMTKRNEEV